MSFLTKTAGRLALAAAITASAGFASTVASAAETIKIGAPLALTGGLADEGKKQQIVYNMWLKLVNDAGGINVGGKKMPVEIITYDYQTDGKRAGQMAEKLIIDDKVDFIMAPFGSGHTKIAAAVTERYGVPLIACVSSSLSVYNQGHKYLFGTLAPNTGMTQALMKFFREQFPKTQRVAILGRDDVFPKSMAKALSVGAKEEGFNVVYDELYAVGTLDHSASLSKIKSLNPDWIYVTGYTNDLMLARKQMQDLGVTAPIVTMVTGPAYKEFVDGLGDLSHGITTASWWHHSNGFTNTSDVWGSTKAFYEQFLKEQGHDPDYVHASCAAGLEVLRQGVEKAGTLDKAKVRDALAATDLNTFYGPVKFGENGMNQVREMPIAQVQNGKMEILSPDIIKTKDIVAMPGS